MNVVHYICPTCGAPACKMRRVDLTYMPTEIEMKQFPEWTNTIGSEHLLCRCGKILTWYSLISIEEVGEEPFNDDFFD